MLPTEGACEQLLGHLNRNSYGKALLQGDDAEITEYGHICRKDFEPLQAPLPQKCGMEMR